MSKASISFTSGPSPISSSRTPKTFDFPSSSLQKTMDELEQQHKIAQQEAFAKQEAEKLSETAIR